VIDRIIDVDIVFYDTSIDSPALPLLSCPVGLKERTVLVDQMAKKEKEKRNADVLKIK